MCLDDHAIKTWSSTQSVIALSTGEAEMYAINKTAASGMGGNSILHDLGVNLDLRVFTDATTGKSLVTRRGLGKVRHIAVNELWLQSHVQAKSITIVKTKNKFNPSDILTKHSGGHIIFMDLGLLGEACFDLKWNCFDLKWHWIDI